MCEYFFKDITKIQNGRQRSTPKNFVGGKTQILLSHSPPYGDGTYFFQAVPKIQNGRHGSTLIFLWAQKL